MLCCGPGLPAERRLQLVGRLVWREASDCLPPDACVPWEGRLGLEGCLRRPA